MPATPHVGARDSRPSICDAPLLHVMRNGVLPCWGRVCSVRGHGSHIKPSLVTALCSALHCGSMAVRGVECEGEGGYGCSWPLATHERDATPPGRGRSGRGRADDHALHVAVGYGGEGAPRACWGASTCALMPPREAHGARPSARYTGCRCFVILLSLES